MLSTLTADHLQIKNGAITITSPGQATPAVYQQLNAELTNVSPTSASPFKLSAQIPGGGSVTGDGTVGPINQATAVATPLNAHVALSHLDLATSGIVAPEAGISGIANIDPKLYPTARISMPTRPLKSRDFASQRTVRLLPSLSMSSFHCLAKYASPHRPDPKGSHHYRQSNHQRRRHLSDQRRNYRAQSQGRAPKLHRSTSSRHSFLPSVSICHPVRVSRVELSPPISTSPEPLRAPIINGPVRIDNTNLAGFDLGSKLGPLSSLAGIKSGSGTAIQSLSANIAINGGNVRTDNVSVIVPSIGSATGSGTISAAGALNYNTVLKLTGILGGGSGKGGSAAGAGGLAGSLVGLIPGGAVGGTAGSVIGNFAGAALRNGVPVAIGGTTSNPTFTPNMGGIVNSASTGATRKGSPKPSQNGANPLSNIVGGLLKQPH